MSPASATEAPVLVVGNQWLGGTGVPVCSASTSENCAGQPHLGGVSYNWWQCVELAQRLYNKMGWYSGIFSGVDSAYQIYDNASQLGMLQKSNNGSYLPVPGDMIIHDPTSNNLAGHVSVVDRVEGNIVHAVEQNASPTGRADYTWSSSGLSRSDVGPIRGIVHDPDNHFTNAPSGNPSGSFDLIQRVPGGVRVAGTATDPDPGQATVDVYYDGGNYVGSAAASPGYDRTVAVPAGAHTVSVWAINIGSGQNVKLGDKPINVISNPQGVVDSVQGGEGWVDVAGWELDQDTTAAGQIDVYADNTYIGSLTANQDRPDVGSVFPGYGNAHGYHGRLSSAAGFHQICAYGINIAAGANTQLGCQSTFVGFTVGQNATNNQAYRYAYDNIGGSSAIGLAVNNVHGWGPGCIQDFSGGSQLRSAIMSRGCINPAYVVAYAFWSYFSGHYGSGNGASVIGYPYNNAHRWGAGNTQDFDGGGFGPNMLMIGDRVGRVYNLFGGIKDVYIQNGGATSFLGYPTSEEYTSGPWTRRDFEGGYILWDTTHGGGTAYRY